MSRSSLIVGLLGLMLASARVYAVVEAEMPLAQLVRDSHVVALVRLEGFDVEKARGKLKLERILRGDEQLENVPIKLLPTSEAEGDPRDMIERVDEGVAIVVFLSHLSATEHQLFAYSSGSWFKLRGSSEGGQLRAFFVQGEPYLRRTFHGDTTELVKAIDDFTAGTVALPGLDKTQKPGLGPKLHESASSPVLETPLPNQIELGPAWRSDVAAPTAERQDPSLRYAIAAVLAVAAVGLVVMLTRSLPESGA